MYMYKYTYTENEANGNLQLPLVCCKWKRETENGNLFFLGQQTMKT
jgi:hypothetical protein